jgi:aryl-alcohol dehydrogenase-like predicted oxidoreductase
VHQGKVRYLGSSTFPAAQIVEAQWVAEKRNRERFVCEQPPYSILVRGIEADVLPTCQRHGMGVIPWSPLAGGWLSGGWRVGADNLTSRRAQRIPARYDLDKPENQAKLEAADALAVLAEQHDVSLIHLALAFVLRHHAVLIREDCVLARIARFANIEQALPWTLDLAPDVGRQSVRRDVEQLRDRARIVLARLSDRAGARHYPGFRASNTMAWSGIGFVANSRSSAAFAAATIASGSTPPRALI